MKSPNIFPTVLQAYIDTGRCLLSTTQAAEILGYQPQTLRKWACYETYPEGLKAVKIGRHLKWRVEELANVVMGGC